MKCIVEMYGLPEKITKQRRVEIRLKDTPVLCDVIAALRLEIPSLVDEAIQPDEDRLNDSYTLNVNGKFFTDYNDQRGDRVLSLKDGDTIALLPLSSGG